MTRQTVGLKSVPTVYALKLDGISGGVQVANNPALHFTGNFSLFAEVRAFQLPINPCVLIGDYNGNYKGYRLAITGVSDTQFLVGRLSDTTVGIVSFSVSLNTKYTLIGVYDGSTHIYRNNVVHNGAAYAPIEAESHLITAGYDQWDLATVFNGYIYRTAIFNTNISPTQVANLSNGTNIPTDFAGCVLYHDYTKGNALDLSGNGNNGILQGNAFFEPQSQFQ